MVYSSRRRVFTTINETNMSDALFIFHEYYKLPINGKLNNETRNLMLKPRCGNPDSIFQFPYISF